jgi:urate oxidase
MTVLGPNRFGKAEVRVVRVARGAAPDGSDLLRDWNVSSSLSGDLSQVFLTGDNSNILTTDAQKNTVYAFAQRLGPIPPEDFALELARHFVSSQPAVARARVHIEEYAWDRISGAHSFVRSGRQVRTVTVVHDAEQGSSVVAGLSGLIVMNTTDSEFWGYVKDPYTTLPETKDRILATEVSAQWRFRDAVCDDWDAAFATLTETLLATFAGTYSYSLQQTVYTIGEKMLAAVPALAEIRFALPNKHHFLVDLEPFGQPNDNEVYFASDRPYGLIEGHVLADDAPPEGLAWS